MIIKVKNNNELLSILDQRYEQNRIILDVSDLDVSEIIDFSDAFRFYVELEQIIGLSNWDLL